MEVRTDIIAAPPPPPLPAQPWRQSLAAFAVDLLLAMDCDNLALLEQRCPPQFASRCRLFLSFAPQAPVAAVPDPYYGTERDFERVLDLVEQASAGLLAFIEKQLAQRV